MSIVRYHNSRSGKILVYESTPHYDPKPKQSRPTRKYLGYELPDTHEFIPSSGKRGRPAVKDRDGSSRDIDDNHPDFENLYNKAVADRIAKEELLSNLQSEMRALQNENRKLSQQLKEHERIFSVIHDLTGSRKD